MGAIRTEYARYFGEPSDLAVFVIDQASFLEPAALHWVDKLLRWLVGEPDVPFGGVLLILAGDFLQKPPPAGASLAETLVAIDAPIPGRKPKTFPPTSSQAKGLDIFRQARRTVFSRQMRAGGDPEFQEVLKNVRSTEAEPPIPRDYVRDLKVLSAADVRADPTRAFAPILVLGNQERHRLNKHQAYAFAKYDDVPLVRWKLPLAGKDAASISDEHPPSLCCDN